MKHIVKRPRAEVLPDDAMIPPTNLISPAPNKFTHTVKRAQPYYFGAVQQGAPANGEFPEGTKVVLMVDDGSGYCRVADGHGLYVVVECDSLERLLES